MNYALLVITTAIWGMGFIATKWTFFDYTAIWSNGIRYGFAAVIALPALIYFRSYQRDFKKLQWVFLASIALGGSMLLQTIGLLYTTAAKSGFITCLYSAFIPLISILFLKKRYSATYWFLLSLSLVGIALLCDLNWKSFNLGDSLTLACAIGFALHFLIVEKIANDFQSGFELNALQCFFVGLVSILLAFSLEGPVDISAALNFQNVLQLTPSSSLGFLSLSVFSSFIAFGVLAQAQKTISAASVGVICLLESPFAALFGYLFLGEELSPTNILGCIIVSLSVLLIPFANKIQKYISWPRRLQKGNLPL